MMAMLRISASGYDTISLQSCLCLTEDCAQLIEGIRRAIPFHLRLGDQQEKRFMVQHWPVILLVDSEPDTYQACTTAVCSMFPEAAVHTPSGQTVDGDGHNTPPDFIIVDYLAGADPLLRIRQLRDRFPATPILVLIPSTATT
jgi:hypothetical protein